MKNNSHNCVRRKWKAGDYFIKQISFLQQLEREIENETPYNMTNEAKESVCDFCGCSDCGEKLSVYNCKRCGANLCKCHILMENHNCIPIHRSWTDYTKWHEMFKT